MKSQLSDDQIEAIAPNFKYRLSGVTATIVRLVPIQSREMGVVSLGPGLPENVPAISFGKLLSLSRKGSNPSGYRVWHARRNSEMLAGLIMKFIFRKKFKLVFTSASQRVHTRYTKFLLSLMDQLISTSHKTARYLSQESEVIHHGIDTDQFQPAQDKRALKERLGFASEALLIGCFGRVRPTKGTDIYIDVLIKLMASNPSAQGIVLGRATPQFANFQTQLMEEVKKHNLSDRIHFPGEVPVDKTPDWYRILDIFVAPQRYEGFGLTPLEAMATGVPVVATKVGAFEEMIIDGESGFIVDIEDREAILEKLTLLVEDEELRKQFGKASRERAIHEFSLQREADTLNSLYKSLLS